MFRVCRWVSSLHSSGWVLLSRRGNETCCLGWWVFGWFFSLWHTDTNSILFFSHLEAFGLKMLHSTCSNPILCYLACFQLQVIDCSVIDVDNLFFSTFRAHARLCYRQKGWGTTIREPLTDLSPNVIMTTVHSWFLKSLARQDCRTSRLQRWHIASLPFMILPPFQYCLMPSSHHLITVSMILTLITPLARPFRNCCAKRGWYHTGIRVLKTKPMFYLFRNILVLLCPTKT